MLEVEVVVEIPKAKVPIPAYEEWARLAWLRPDQGVVSIALVDNASIREMNNAFRRQDKETDILSFPSNPLASGVYSGGDMAICEAVVAAKAREYGKSITERMALTVVHGILHLQGYHHSTDANASRMEEMEIKILAGIGIFDPYII